MSKAVSALKDRPLPSTQRHRAANPYKPRNLDTSCTTILADHLQSMLVDVQDSLKCFLRYQHYKRSSR